MTELKWEIAKHDMNIGLVFIEFYTTWCPDCKMMEPVVLEAEMEAKKAGIPIRFMKVNAEEAKLFRDKNSDLEVLKVPSFFVIKNGKRHHIGYEYLPKEVLVEAIKKHA